MKNYSLLVIRENNGKPMGKPQRVQMKLELTPVVGVLFYNENNDDITLKVLEVFGNDLNEKQ